MKPSKRIIGLTGNIGSGKSTVSKHLIKRGFYVIDADIVAREVVAVGTEGLKRVIETFGSQYLAKDGTLNRQKLGEHVFSKPKELEKLNRILHPIILRRLIRAIELTEEQVVFIDAALIYESGLDKLMDMIWFVGITEELQVQRLMKRDHATREEALRRIGSQMNQEDKRKRADVTIENNGTKAELYRKIDDLILGLGLDNAESATYN